MSVNREMCEGCQLKGEDFYTGADVCKGSFTADNRCATRDAYQIAQLEAALVEVSNRLRAGITRREKENDALKKENKQLRAKSPKLKDTLADVLERLTK